MHPALFFGCRRSNAAAPPAHVSSSVAAASADWIYSVDRPGSGASNGRMWGPLPHPPPDTADFTVEYEVLRKIDADVKDQQMQVATLRAKVQWAGGQKHTFLVVTYRGTADAQDWLYNTGMAINWDKFREYGIGVHGGWQAVLSEEYGPQMPQSRTSKFLNRVLNTEFDSVLVTGHSLGGALAMISALRMKQLADGGAAGLLEALSLVQKKKIVTAMSDAQCITFAAPTPFAPSTDESVAAKRAEAMDWLAGHALNFVNANDAVPRLPNLLRFVTEELRTPTKIGFGMVPVNDLPTAFPLHKRYQFLSRVRLVGHGMAPQEARPGREAEALLAAAPSRPGHRSNRPSAGLSRNVLLASLSGIGSLGSAPAEVPLFALLICFAGVAVFILGYMYMFKFLQFQQDFVVLACLLAPFASSLVIVRSTVDPSWRLGVALRCITRAAVASALNLPLIPLIGAFIKGSFVFSELEKVLPEEVLVYSWCLLCFVRPPLAAWAMDYQAWGWLQPLLDYTLLLGSFPLIQLPTLVVEQLAEAVPTALLVWWDGGLAQAVRDHSMVEYARLVSQAGHP